MAPLTDNIISAVVQEAGNEVNVQNLANIEEALKEERDGATSRLIQAFRDIGKLKTYVEVEKYIEEERPFAQIYYLKYPTKEDLNRDIFLQAIVALPASLPWDVWKAIVEKEHLDEKYLHIEIEECRESQALGVGQRVIHNQETDEYLLPMTIYRSDFSEDKERADFLDGVSLLQRVCEK